MNRVLLVFSAIFFDPRKLINKFKALPIYFSNIYHYSKGIKKDALSLEFWKLRFYTSDRFSNAGSVSGAYFFQDIWAAKKVYESKVNLHVDVGSRIDGFVAHLLSFCNVEYIDIRPMISPFGNLVFKLNFFDFFG
jgi:hypothetical protein